MFLPAYGCETINRVAFNSYKKEIRKDTIHIEVRTDTTRKDSIIIDTVRYEKKFHSEENNPKTFQTKWYITLMVVLVGVFVVVIRN